MRKIIAAICILALVLGLSSCGEQGKKASNNTGSSEGSDSLKTEQPQMSPDETTPLPSSKTISKLAFYSSSLSKALLKNGELLVWEKEYIDEKSFTERPVNKLKDVIQADIYGETVAAVKADGSVWLCGPDIYGLTGEPEKANERVFGEKKIVKIYDNAILVRMCEGNIAIIGNDNSLYIAGNNYYGQVGVEQSNVYEPLTKIMDEVIDVRFGDCCTVALKNDGSVWTWGSNMSGSLGNGTNGDSDAHPVPTKVMDDVSSIIIGGNLGFQKTIALKNDGSAWVWGGSNGVEQSNQNAQGSPNIGTDAWGRPVYTAPIKIMDDVVFADITKSGSGNSNVPNAIFITSTGELYLWVVGKLSDSQLECSEKPVKMLDGVANAAISSVSAAAVKKDNSLWFWGTISNDRFTSWDSFTQIAERVKDVYIDRTNALYTVSSESGGEIIRWNGETFDTMNW